MRNKRGFDYIWTYGLGIVCFVIVACQVFRVTGPVIMPDEVGYWATGAWLAGYDWSGVMHMSPYYGVGYGFFLSVFAFFFKDPLTMFRGAVLLNAFFIVLIYCMVLCMAKYILPELKNWMKAVTSFVLTMYAFNIYYAVNSEAEIIQVLIYLLICYLFLNICLKGKKKYDLSGVMLAVLSVYLCACHQRNIGIVVVLFFSMVLLVLLDKFTKMSFCFFMCSLIIAFLAFFYFKNIVNNNIYVVSGYTSEEASKVSGALGIFTVKGLKSFIECFLGRFFYIGCASFLIAYKGIILLIRKLLIVLKEKKEYDKFFAFEFFIVCVLLAEIAIGALAFLGNERRIDGFLYGRYSDHVMIPILLYGFKVSFEIKNKLVWQSGCSIFLIFLSFYMGKIYLNYNTLETSTHSISGIIGMPILRNYDAENIQILFSVGVAQFSLILSWIIYYFETGKNYNRKIVGVAITGFCWCLFAFSALMLYFFSFNDYNKDLYSFAMKVEEVKPDNKIYYALDKETESLNPTSSTWLMYRIQFFMPRTSIHVIDLDEVKEGSYVLVYRYSKENQVLIEKKAQALVEGERMILYSTF